jgi:O-antigen/teichoic acid export membrane protein
VTRVAQDSARGGFFLISGSAMATVISAITSILIARFLGPELYGQYALALVAPNLLYLFTDLGVNQAITKFTSALKSEKQADGIPNIVKHGMIARAVIGVTIFALNYFLAGTIATYLLQRPDLEFYIQIASISILFQVIFTTATSAFVGLDKTEYQAISANTQAIAKAIASITLILAGLGIVGAITGYSLGFVASSFVALPLLYLLLRKKKTANKGDSFKQNMKMLFKYGSPLYISVLLVGFIPVLNSVILAFFTTDTNIGNYKAATNFAALLIVLAEPITTVLLPAFSKLNRTSNQKIRDFFKIVVKYTTILVIPVASLITVFSTEIVQIIYGSTYNLAPLFLSVLVLVYFLVGIGYLTLPSLYNGLGETKTTLKMNLISFFVLITVAVPLTQMYSVTGLITAFVISLVAGTFYGAYTARKRYQIELGLRKTAKIYLISALASVLPLLIKNVVNMSNIFSLVIGSFLYLSIFITLMPLTNVVSLLELEKISLAVRNTPFLKQFAYFLIKYQQKIFRLKTNFKSSSGSKSSSSMESIDADIDQN